MGWKNVKEHYRIDHIVQVRDGIIYIGSSYIHDLITVTIDGQVKQQRGSSNEDINRYLSEMDSDREKLLDLVNAPDAFSASLPVFTYDGGEIIEKQCEAYGWPNVTHDGMLMYENMFSADRNQVIEWAKRESELGVKFANQQIEELRKKITEAESWKAESIADLEKLNRLAVEIER